MSGPRCAQRSPSAWLARFGPGVAPVAAQTTAQRALQIQALSTRPDLVSGGDVLIRISTPAGTVPESMSVMLNGRDVTSAFRPSAAANGRVGLIRDLRLGKNELVARTKDREPAATLTLINHPVTGPVIAGPHQTPFVCETEAFGSRSGRSTAIAARRRGSSISIDRRQPVLPRPRPPRPTARKRLRRRMPRRPGAAAAARTHPIRSSRSTRRRRDQPISPRRPQATDARCPSSCAVRWVPSIARCM